MFTRTLENNRSSSDLNRWVALLFSATPLVTILFSSFVLLPLLLPLSIPSYYVKEVNADAKCANTQCTLEVTIENLDELPIRVPGDRVIVVQTCLDDAQVAKTLTGYTGQFELLNCKDKAATTQLRVYVGSMGNAMVPEEQSPMIPVRIIRGDSQKL